MKNWPANSILVTERRIGPTLPACRSNTGDKKSSRLSEGSNLCQGCDVVEWDVALQKELALYCMRNISGLRMQRKRGAECLEVIAPQILPSFHAIDGKYCRSYFVPLKIFTRLAAAFLACTFYHWRSIYIINNINNNKQHEQMQIGKDQHMLHISKRSKVAEFKQQWVSGSAQSRASFWRPVLPP
eukprot:scaffold190689_cov21-Prasinocladus_malaysianus.AAC.1